MIINTSKIQIQDLESMSDLTSVILRSLTYECNLPTEEQKWDIIKAVRNDLLTQSDWVIVNSYESNSVVPLQIQLISQLYLKIL